MPFENAIGNAGLLTTIGDLLRWNKNFREETVGGDKLIQAQLQQGHLNNGQILDYAAGLEVVTYRGLQEVSHSGQTAGYQAWLAQYPQQKFSVAILCNTDTANPWQLGHKTVDIYLTSVLSRPTIPVEFRPDSAVLRSEAGMYRSDRDNTVISIEVRDNRLQIAHGAVLRTISPSNFTMGEAGPDLVFYSDATGTITGFDMVSLVDGPRHYTRVAIASPTRAELGAMVGDYRSEEAQVTLKLSLEESGLVIHAYPDSFTSKPSYHLIPTYEGAFDSSGVSVRFFHDASGNVTEMSIGENRVWDLRFKRLRALDEKDMR
jgi:hypothetical protein